LALNLIIATPRKTRIDATSTNEPSGKALISIILITTCSSSIECVFYLPNDIRFYINYVKKPAPSRFQLFFSKALRLSLSIKPCDKNFSVAEYEHIAS
jgi:hypothetical protein